MQTRNSGKTEKATAGYSSGLDWEYLVSDVRTMLCTWITFNFIIKMLEKVNNIIEIFSLGLCGCFFLL